MKMGASEKVDEWVTYFEETFVVDGVYILVFWGQFPPVESSGTR